MRGLAESAWRFDQVMPAHQWAACVWEYCREYMQDVPDAQMLKLRRKGGRSGRDRMATIGQALKFDEFPSVPWLELSSSLRNDLEVRWSYAPSKLEDYSMLPELAVIEGARSAEAWRCALHKLGLVVFDLGVPPLGSELRPKGQAYLSPGRRPTRAELLGRFEAWLDENPLWWSGHGDRRSRSSTAGKRDPADGLRVLAWTRLFRVWESHGSVEEYVKKCPAAKSWLLPNDSLSAERARKLPVEAKEWLKMVCQS